MKKAVFLDRDGVLNRERGEYTYRKDDFEILPGVTEALKKLQDDGWLLIVVTNQGGIAKGIYSEDDFRLLNEILITELKKEGVHLDEIYYCPHHPDRTRCLCRKPGSLLFEKAIARFGIDPGISWMIGDKQRDADAASGAGIKTILMEANSPLLPKLEQIIARQK